jgi:hypothetical protein
LVASEPIFVAIDPISDRNDDPFIQIVDRKAQNDPKGDRSRPKFIRPGMKSVPIDPIFDRNDDSFIENDPGRERSRPKFIPPE